MATVPGLDERDTRFKRLRESMQRENLDALVIAGKGHWWTGRGYYRYLTDFHLWAHDGAILFPLEGEPYLTLTSGAVAGRIGKRGWITDVAGDPEITVKIVRKMKERGLARGRVGVCGYEYIMPAQAYACLIGSLPDVEFVKADHVIDRVRAVKSPLEIQQQRELWSLAKAAMARFVEVLAPGKTEWELAAEASKVILAGGGRDILVFLGGSPPEDKPVNLDGILGYHMEVTGPSGHWCELTVTLAFRDPTKLELRLMDTELRAYEEIRKQAVPGVRLSALTDTLERVYLEDGWQLAEKQSPHHDLHGEGMDTIEWPLYGILDTRWDAALEAGMTFSYHPRRNVLPDVRATGINENIVITPVGAERLSEPWDLRWRVM